MQKITFFIYLFEVFKTDLIKKFIISRIRKLYIHHHCDPY